MSSFHKILYVEDEQDIRSIAQIALVDVGGFNIEVCESGEVALEKASIFKPELLLLDVMMPGMNGPQTLEKLRELDVTKKTPVIFMTAKVQPQEIESYIQLGAIGVIEKPFDPMTLASEIRELLD